MKKTHCSQTAYEALKEMIVKQDLLPGQQIVESSFADKMGISRTPLREAIRMLEKDGLVDIFPYKGAYIKSFRKDEVVMGFEAAEGLEGMAAYLTAERVAKGELNAEDLDGMEVLVKELDEHLKNGNLKAWGLCDEKFHDTFAELSGNVFLVEALKKIRTQLNCVLWFITPAGIDKKLSNYGHRKILAAIRCGDHETARHEAQRHRHRVRDELIKLL